jgi:L,D-peptidoglycan transpeptidase YkuD (ErfK/YbiS/YcfS/YnhG family)
MVQYCISVQSQSLQVVGIVVQTAEPNKSTHTGVSEPTDWHTSTDVEVTPRLMRQELPEARKTPNSQQSREPTAAIGSVATAVGSKQASDGTPTGGKRFLHGFILRL